MFDPLTEVCPDIPAGAPRRICCDVEMIPVVLGSRRGVLDVGRLQRLVTAAIWKALVSRDRHCRFPGCRRPPSMCHAHHVIHWIHGGPTILANLLLLCGHHHRLAIFDPPPGTTRARLTSPHPPPRE